MKRLGNMVLLTTSELADLETKWLDKGEKLGGKSSQKRIEDLEIIEKKKTREITKLQDTILDLNALTNRLQETVNVHQEQEDTVRDIVKKEILLNDKEAILEAKKEGLDELTASLKDRENKLRTEEDLKDRSAYADGLADGLRKAHEITEKDRHDAMKIAMVAASSHTPVANLQELNNAHQITAGTSDKQAK